MRIFVTGHDGLLGRSLVPILAERHVVDGFGVEDGDIADREFVRERLESFAPDAVIHLAAMTAVDECESRREEAFRVNSLGSRVVVEESARVEARVLGISTDYVFDGAGRRPYRETDPPRPLGIYGESKLAGEEAVGCGPGNLVVRSAWLFGPGGRNFVDTILGALDARGEVRVVNDQTGSPTYAPDLALGLLLLVESGAQGLYHLVNGGEATWFDLAREAARLSGRDPEAVLPASTEEVGRPAPRPAYSVLDCGRVAEAFGLRLRPWPAALAEYLERP